MNIDKLTENDVTLIRQIKAAERRKAVFFKPAPRVRRPWMGTLNWERHKKKQAAKRKAHNIIAHKSRAAQHRA